MPTIICWIVSPCFWVTGVVATGGGALLSPGEGLIGRVSVEEGAGTGPSGGLPDPVKELGSAARSESPSPPADAGILDAFVEEGVGVELSLLI